MPHGLYPVSGTPARSAVLTRTSGRPAESERTEIDRSINPVPPALRSTRRPTSAEPSRPDGSPRATRPEDEGAAPGRRRPARRRPAGRKRPPPCPGSRRRPRRSVRSAGSRAPRASRPRSMAPATARASCRWSGAGPSAHRPRSSTRTERAAERASFAGVALFGMVHSCHSRTPMVNSAPTSPSPRWSAPAGRRRSATCSGWSSGPTSSRWPGACRRPSCSPSPSWRPRRRACWPRTPAPSSIRRPRDSGPSGSGWRGATAPAPSRS